MYKEETNRNLIYEKLGHIGGVNILFTQQVYFLVYSKNYKICTKQLNLVCN